MHSNLQLVKGKPVREETSQDLASFARLRSVKRAYDLFFSFCGLVLLSPIFLIIATLIKLSDRGPVFYRQARIGLGGSSFFICKFRTMVPEADKAGPSLTKGGDARVTRIGRFLRQTKLDELPQLWNVLKGEMSLVGPRPEVPRYVRLYSAEQREILGFKPGITDLASLCFRDEEALLRNAMNMEDFYMQHCVPRKLKLNQEYAARANLLSDTWIIIQTLCPYWVGVLVAHAVLLAASFWFSYQLINDFTHTAITSFQFRSELLGIVALQLACLMWRKQCRGLLSYFNLLELRQVGFALGLAGIVLLVSKAAFEAGPPRNVILLHTLLSFTFLSGFRVLLRCWRERSEEHEPIPEIPARIGIIGAGSTGAQFALELMHKRKCPRAAMVFFDDDFRKWQKCIHGIPVVGMPECLLEGWREKLDEVVIAMPSSLEDRIREINLLLGKAGLTASTISRCGRHECQPKAA